MNLNIDRDSKVPVYEQIQQQIVHLVRDGLLTSGTRIPSVRELARDLGVSVKTVRSAYDELAAEHVIETRQGSGTFVADRPDVVFGENLRTREEMVGNLSELPRMRWDPYPLSNDFFGMPQSKRHGGGLIRLTQSSPDPALFPFERIKQVATNMLWYPQQFFFDYGNPQGYQPFVQYLEKEMALAGVPMAEGENDIILTGGFQRSLSLLLDQLVAPGQKVAVEAPTFTGILNLLIAKKIGYVPIPMDGEGMDTEYLASVLGNGDIRAVITIPTYHNPTGITMSQSRREQLMRLAAKHRMPIIEDDWGRLLRYEGEAPPPLKSMDPGGYVIHIGTFSKCFLPGMRIGWITCPAELSMSLVCAKTGADSGDSQFLQALLHEFILKGHFQKHVRHSLKQYRKRRDVMCETLRRHLPSGCKFRTPNGGLFIWVELPEHIKSLPLLTLARQAGVEFLPSAFCMPDRKDTCALRLSFSRSTTDEIEVGIKSLCSVISDCIDNPGLISSGATDFEELYI
jgi:DNA-binding transcriptional MocR family regulator